MAASVQTADGDYLVTHAGVTAGFWRDVLGAPPTAAGAADTLNALIGTGDERVFEPGELLGGGAPNRMAGPLWARRAPS